MELFSSVVIRASFVSVGYISAMYLAYKIRPSKRSLIDVVLVFSLMLVMSIETEPEWILLKLMSYLGLGYLLLTINHKKDWYGSMLFSLILVMVLSLNDSISFGILANVEPFINAVENQEDTIYGLLAVLIPSFVTLLAFLVSGYILRKTIPLDNSRSKITYVMFSLFYLFLLIAISLVLNHVIVYISPGIPLEQVYRFTVFIYIPIFVIVSFSYYYLYHILKWEMMIKKREAELLKAELRRRDGYRANHNLDNIVLTIHTLVEKKDYKELKEYLAKM
jgi:hypothetical protein